MDLSVKYLHHITWFLVGCDLLWAILLIEGSIQCGKPAHPPSLSKRIVGGKAAAPHSWPWQVSLRIGERGHICGATLIDPQWVLTAAHCIVRKEPSDVTLRFGLRERKSMTATSLEIGAAEFHTREDYEDGCDEHGLCYTVFYNDIGLVKLSEAIQYTDKISPVCMPAEGLEPQPRDIVYATGWGTTTPTSPYTYPNTLQQVDLYIISWTECNEDYDRLLESTHLCAGNVGGKDTCKRDSGGPLVYNNNGEWTLVGVTSFGSGCGREPGVYAKVPSYLNWINSTIAEH